MYQLNINIKEKTRVMNCNFILEDYRCYYSSVEFQRDMMSWFDISMQSYKKQKFPWIGFASGFRNSHPRPSIPSSTKEKSFYFSFCVFLHCLQAQAIFKLSGRDIMYRFHAETGVPQISCGLGGIMHPAHTLLEADLLPVGAEVEAYIKMIDIILPEVRPQVEELGKYADTDELYKIIEDEILSFRQRLQNGVAQPTYLVEGI